MNSDSIIHARSERLVTCLEDYANGEIDMETVELLIDAEEANADVPRKEFFDEVRELARMIEVD